MGIFGISAPLILSFINFKTQCMFSQASKKGSKIFFSNKTPATLLQEFEVETVTIQTDKLNYDHIIKYEECFQKILKHVVMGNYAIKKIEHFTMFGEFSKYKALAMNSTTKEIIPLFNLKNNKVYYDIKDHGKAKPSFLTSLHIICDENGVVIKAPIFGEGFDIRQELYEGLASGALRCAFNELLLTNNPIIVITKKNGKITKTLYTKEALYDLFKLESTKMGFGEDFDNYKAAAQLIIDNKLVKHVQNFSKGKYFSTQSKKYKIAMIVEEQKEDPDEIGQSQFYVSENIADNTLENTAQWEADIRNFENILNLNKFNNP